LITNPEQRNKLSKKQPDRFATMKSELTTLYHEVNKNRRQTETTIRKKSP